MLQSWKLYIQFIHPTPANQYAFSQKKKEKNIYCNLIVFKKKRKPISLRGKEQMKSCRVLIFTLSVLLLLFPSVHGWGAEGHLTVCRIAQVSIFFIFFFSLRRNFWYNMWLFVVETVSAKQSGSWCRGAIAAEICRKWPGECVYMGRSCEVSISLVICPSLHWHSW